MLRVLGGGVAIVAIAAVLGVALTAWSGGSSGGTGTVPNVIGLQLDRAIVAAREAGFELGTPVYVRRDDQPEGTVVDQDPPPGTVADRGATIEPLVSTGRQLVEVPNVAGLTEAQAIARLAEVGLTVRRARVAPDPIVPSGSVIASEPVAGTSVATGTSVGIVVSSGP